MDKRHEQILNDFEQELKWTLNLSYLMSNLVKRKLLTEDEVAQLKHPNKINSEKNGEFLNILKTKGSKAFPRFLEALKEEEQHLGHEDLYDKLMDADKISQTVSTPPGSCTRNSSQLSFETASVTDSSGIQSPQSEQVESQSSPTHSRNNSAGDVSSIATGMSMASVNRIMEYLERMDNSLKIELKTHDNKLKVLEEKIDLLQKEFKMSASKIEREFKSPRLGFSPNTFESGSDYSTSAYDGDNSASSSDANLQDHSPASSSIINLHRQRAASRSAPPKSYAKLQRTHEYQSEFKRTNVDPLRSSNASCSSLEDQKIQVAITIELRSYRAVAIVIYVLVATYMYS